MQIAEENANFGFESDASVFAKSPVLREELTQIFAKSAEKRIDRSSLYEGLAPILRDFGRDSYGTERTASQKTSYLIRQVRHKGLSWATAVLLAWLCVHRQEDAKRLYQIAGLASRFPDKFRAYEGIPGEWAARRAAKEPDESPGPIIPDDYDPDDDGPALERGSARIAPIRLPHPDGITNAEFSRDGSRIITAGKKRAGKDACAYIWPVTALSSGTRKSIVATSGAKINFAAFSPSGSRVIIAAKNVASVWYASTSTEEIYSFDHKKQISMCSYSNDGSMVATASWDQTASVRCAHTGEDIKTFSPSLGRNEVVNSAFFSPDDKQLVLACENGVVSIWDIESQSLVRELTTRGMRTVGSAMFSNDGKRVLAAYENGTAVVWNAADGTILKVFGADDGHEDMVWSAEYSTDEKRIVTASSDRFAIIWDAETGEILARLKHGASLYSAHFSPDGCWVLTACNDGMAYLWRVA